MLTVGSLFAGIGGMELGLERAGMQVRWQVEIDPFCQRVLAKHWPDVPRYGDVRDVGTHNLEPVEVICGGFPCTEISHAGRRAGIHGGQSGLWSEFERIVRELRPRYVLVENSSSLVVRGAGTILGGLAQLGYDTEWDCLPAAFVGAHHLRARQWILAYSGGVGHRAPEETVFAGRDCPELRGGWPAEPGVGRVANGIPNRVDRLRALGNAVVPQVAEWIGRRILEAERSQT